MFNEKATPWMTSRKPVRILLTCLGLGILLTMYLSQRFNFAALLLDVPSTHPYLIFVFNKTLRLIVNDAACFIIILAIFQETRYLRLSFYVFLIELLLILPVYFFIKLSLEGDSEISSPLLSQIHRLIVNPTLMILLMIGFFYQQHRRS